MNWWLIHQPGGQSLGICAKWRLPQGLVTEQIVRAENAHDFAHPFWHVRCIAYKAIEWACCPLDNGKPAVTLGRKATGLFETAGLPKEEVMNPYTTTRTLSSLLIAAASLLTAVFVSPASAQTWSSNIQGQSPPANVHYDTNGAWESDTSIVGFFEGDCRQLEDDLVVNINSPGSYSGGGNTPLQGLEIPEGTWVRSHFLHADLDTEAEVDWTGWVEVDEDILGVIIEDETLDLSSSLEVPGTDYSNGVSNRGMESNDSITLLAGMRRLEIDRWHMTRPGDELRFVTSCACPPRAPESVNGDLLPQPPPASVDMQQGLPGGWESDTEILAFYESCVELPVDLDVDGGTIPAGTQVRCRLLHFDSTDSAITQQASGSVFLSEPLLGLITTGAGLDTSDPICGAPGTVYPASGLAARGLEQIGGFTDTAIHTGNQVDVNF